MTDCTIDKSAKFVLTKMSDALLIHYARKIHISMDSAALIEALTHRLEKANDKLSLKN